MDQPFFHTPSKFIETLAKGETDPANLIAGRYEIVNTYVGGMGLVHLCRDHQETQLVALKTFKPEYLSHITARDLFLREGTTWVELGRHPHIVRAHRVERLADGQVFLVLSWILQPKGKDNPSLRAWLVPGRPLPVEQALLFALHITRGLKYATTKIPGLVHRDLKPENVLVGYDGIARVTDFGLASTLSQMKGGVGSMANSRENFSRTQLTQGVAGTPLYMAPEQWLHKATDLRADIYALGCIFYEMITGQFAAEGETREELRDIHVNGRIKPPPSTIPHSVLSFLRKCMMKDREQRYRSWHDVEDAITAVYRQLTGAPPEEEKKDSKETTEERVNAGHSYNTMGLSYLDIGKLPVAVIYFEQAVWIARAERSASLECMALGNLGMAYVSLGYVKRAIEFFEEQLTIARKINDRSEECRALGNLGSAFRQMNEPMKAIGFHAKELELVQELNDRFKEATAFYRLGDTYRQLNNVSEAVTYYKQSLAIAREIGDRARLRTVLSSMGQIYLSNGEAKEAAALFHQALELARGIADRVGEGKALADLGLLYQTLSYNSRAIEFYNYALTIAQANHDLRQEATNLLSLGDLYLKMSESAKAKGYYEAALAAVQEVSDQVREMQILHKLGQIYTSLKNHIEAAAFHRQALFLVQELGNIPMEQEILFHLAKAYENWGDTGRTVQYFEQHLAISRKQDNRVEQMKVLPLLGKLYHYRLKQPRPAEEAYTECLEMAEIDGNYTLTGEMYNQLGELARDTGDPKKALEWYEKATKLAQERKDIAAEAITTSNMALAANDMGVWGWQAGRYADKAMKLAQKSQNSEAQALVNYRIALFFAKQEKWKYVREPAERAAQLFAVLKEEAMADKAHKLLADAERLAKA